MGGCREKTPPARRKTVLNVRNSSVGGPKTLINPESEVHGLQLHFGPQDRATTTGSAAQEPGRCRSPRAAALGPQRPTTPRYNHAVLV